MAKKELTTGEKMASAKRGMLKVQEVSQAVQSEIMESEGFVKTIAIASGLVAIEEAMTDEVVAVLERLQGNPMGFKADKVYPSIVVKQVAIRASMFGAHWHGNEFNIIAGQCYLTKEYFERKLREYEGVTDLVLDIYCPEDGVQKNNQVQLKVGGYASCRVHGNLVEVFAKHSEKYGDQRFVVSAFGGDIDQAMGKAKKRLAQKLYERIAGVVITEAEEGGSVSVKPMKQIESEKSRKPTEAEQFRARVDKAIAAYGECKTEAEFESVDGKMAQLFSECNKASQQEITDARDAASARIEELQVAK